jgi:agmatinase
VVDPLPRVVTGSNVGQLDNTRVPRFAGPPTFAQLPRIDEVDTTDIAVVGIPFDAGVSYRPGARFGPAAIRAASKLLRPYNPAVDLSPFAVQQIADAGDLSINPFSLEEAVINIEQAARELRERASRLLVLGGDHTVALPLLRAVASQEPVAVVHFDAHLDTWDSYFGAAYTHGTPFRRASEEGLLDTSACVHVGTRGPLYGARDLIDDRDLGFAVLPATEIDALGATGIAERIRARVGGRPIYVSIDIDVLDPAFAPGTGTPEAGGMTSRELLAVLRGMAGLRIVGCDIVEVAPVYDHAEITSVAASHVAYELVSVMAQEDAS